MDPGVTVLGGVVDPGGSLLADGRRVEAGLLLTGVEEREHPIPNWTHKSLVTLGSGCTVSTGLLLSRED